MIDRLAPVYYVAIKPTGAPNAEPVDVTDRVEEFIFEETEKAADKLTLKVNNFDLSHFDEPVFRKGAELHVSWGYPGRMAQTRQVVVQKVTGGLMLQVEALAKSILMHKEARSRTFDSVTRSEVVQRVAAENGYSAANWVIDETPVRYDHIVQARETDAAFLMRLAKDEGFEFFVDWDGLHWHQRKLDQRPLREYVYYLPTGSDGNEAEGDVISFDVDNDITATPAQVVMQGRDPIEKKDFTTKSDDTSTQRSGLGTVLEAVDPATGQTKITTKATGTAITVPTHEPTADAAKRTGDAIYRNGQLATIKLKLKALGDPLQLAKVLVHVSGLRSLSGNYYVTLCKHMVNASAYVMDMELKRDARSQENPPRTEVPKSSAKPNTQQPANDPGALVPKEIVDPATGQTKIVYVPSGGRPQ